MKTFRNIKFTKRNYDCTNVVCCVAESAPNGDWQECDGEEIAGLTHLFTRSGVCYYGFL